MDFEIQQNYNEDEIIDKIKEDISSVIQNKKTEEERINDTQEKNNSMREAEEEIEIKTESDNEKSEQEEENEELNKNNKELNLEKESKNSNEENEITKNIKLEDKNIENDKSYSFEDDKNIKNDEEKDQINEEKNNDNESKENKIEKITKDSLVLPKEFKYLLDTVKEFNDVLSITTNPDFVKNALKKELKEELIKTSKNIAKQFAKETIEKFDKNHFQMIKEKKKMEFVKNLDLNSPVIKDKINLIYLDRKEQHKQSVFDYNDIYWYYGKLVKNKPKYKDYFDKIIKVNFFVEDYFIL